MRPSSAMDVLLQEDNRSQYGILQSRLQSRVQILQEYPSPSPITSHKIPHQFPRSTQMGIGACNAITASPANAATLPTCSKQPLNIIDSRGTPLVCKT